MRALWMRLTLSVFQAKASPSFTEPQYNNVNSRELCMWRNNSRKTRVREKPRFKHTAFTANVLVDKECKTRKLFVVLVFQEKYFPFISSMADLCFMNHIKRQCHDSLKQEYRQDMMNTYNLEDERLAVGESSPFKQEHP